MTSDDNRVSLLACHIAVLVGAILYLDIGYVLVCMKDVDVRYVERAYEAQSIKMHADVANTITYTI